jgi:alpha-L-fucosidase
MYIRLALALALTATAQSYQPTWESIDKRPTPSWFTDAKFGIFIHWGVYSVPAYAPVIPGKLAYAEWYWNAMTNGRNNPKASAIQTGTWAFHQRMYGADYPYQNFAPQFRAELYDPDHWASVFERSGAKYVVLTSKHHEGFTLWPNREASATWGRPWNAVETGPKRDILGDLTTAVRKKGLEMGFYYSLYEWYNPLWLSDKPRYIREHMTPQFKDLVTKYQPSLIFADGEWDLPSADWGSPSLLAWLFNESPVKDKVVINDRWGKDSRHKHGGYHTTEYTPGMAADATHPWEESRGMGFSYGYNRAERAEHYHTGRELVIMLCDLVSRGGNLLLDIGPGADGTIPVVMEERLLQIGSWMKVNGEAIYATKPYKNTRQWSAGEVPKAEYNKEYEAAYDVTQLTRKQPAGKASIEAFFTAKGSDLVYAILPRWPESKQFTLKDVGATKEVSLLGSSAPLQWKAAGANVTVDVPAIPENLLQQPAWVIRVRR